MFRGQRECEAVFSYASPNDGPWRRAFIEFIEYLTGRSRLENMYLSRRATLRPDDNVWAVTVRGLELDIEFNEDKLAKVPRNGPLVVVANHPFGFIDGLVLCYLISTVRPDFKVFTNKVMCRVPEVETFMLPIDFADTREAVAANARTRSTGKAFLRDGGCLITFPSGAVSTSPTLFAPAIDCEWHPFAGRLILQCRAAVLPVHFRGQNSRLFQIASHLSLDLRLSLLMRELTRRMGTAVEVRVGDVIPFEKLEASGGPAPLMNRLRRATYALATNVEAATRLEVDERAAHLTGSRFTAPADTAG